MVEKIVEVPVEKIIEVPAPVQKQDLVEPPSPKIIEKIVAPKLLALDRENYVCMVQVLKDEPLPVQIITDNGP